MPIITFITLFVLALLIWCVIRYNKKSNPVPARWSHNTVVEVVWTLVPVLILVFISIFSFRLLFNYNDMPKPYMTIKATGYQWYWGYEYPDQKIPEFVSNILPEDKAKAKGVPYKLAATEPLVVPVNQVVEVLVTGADVIHAFAVPSFGIITDAVPGKVNHTWFQGRPDRHLLRQLPRTVRRRPRLHADRGQGRQPGRLRRLGGFQDQARRRAGRDADHQRGRRRHGIGHARRSDRHGGCGPPPLPRPPHPPAPQAPAAH